MSALRRSGLIDESRGQVTILDKRKLACMSQFDTDYLHARKLDFAVPSELGGRSDMPRPNGVIPSQANSPRMPRDD